MSGSCIALIDDLAVRRDIDDAAGRLSLDVVFPDAAQAADVVGFLVAQQPRLIVVDTQSSALDWERWILAAKTSPATRKIPMLAFGPGAQPAGLARARRAGCDAVVDREAFMADIAGHLARHMRPDERAALAAAARLPLPKLAHEAIAQFNAGAYFEQHETFETLWRAEPGPIRQMYQGILQVGVAYLQIQRGNFIGARKLFQRAWQYLAALPEVCQGVDIARLRADAQAAQAELERLGPERIAAFPPELLKPVRMTDPA